MHILNPNETYEILQLIRDRPLRADILQNRFKKFEQKIVDYATDQLIRLNLITRSYERVGKIDFIVWEATERGKQVVDGNIPLRSLA